MGYSFYNEKLASLLSYLECRLKVNPNSISTIEIGALGCKVKSVKGITQFYSHHDIDAWHEYNVEQAMSEQTQDIF